MPKPRADADADDDEDAAEDEADDDAIDEEFELPPAVAAIEIDEAIAADAS